MNAIKTLTFDDLMALRGSTVTVLKVSQRTFNIIDMGTTIGSKRTGATVLTCDFKNPPDPDDIKETLEFMDECSCEEEYLDRSPVYKMEWHDSFELEPLMVRGSLGRAYFILPRSKYINS